MTALEIAALWEKLELDLTGSLKRNLARHQRQEEAEGGQNGVPEHWEAWQSAKLRDIRRFRQENEALLGKYASKTNEETGRMLKEQYTEGGSEGFFRASDARLQALIDEMQNNESRIGQASLRYMDDVYRKTILRTATALNAGGMTYQKAVDEATKDFLAQGINCIQYANGRQVNIASYAEMALRTCATRAMLMGEARKREQLGIDTVLVSQYGACSDTCLPWQGRVYIDDVFQDYSGPRGGSFGISRNGKQYMFLSIAMQGGLFHPNCRHTISTWIDGISKKPEPMDIAQIEKINKLEAYQRQLERAVRQAKREAAGLQDPVAQKKARAKAREKQKILRDFVEEHGDVLRRDYWRERDDGTAYGRIAAAPDMDKMGGVAADGTFDLEMAKREYKKFLTTVPERNRIYLEQSFSAVEYQEAKMPGVAFGYSYAEDKILYNPANPDFRRIDFATVNTHELSHRVDRMFVQSETDEAFCRSIRDAENIITRNPEPFVQYCWTHDDRGFLSDILDAISSGRYDLPARHGQEYWLRPGAKAREIFANIYSLQAFGDWETLVFLTEHFPEIMQYFDVLLP